jgi:hypothetical protein
MYKIILLIILFFGCNRTLNHQEKKFNLDKEKHLVDSLFEKKENLELLFKKTKKLFRVTQTLKVYTHNQEFIHY